MPTQAENISTSKNPEGMRLGDSPNIGFLFGDHANSGKETLTNLKRALEGEYYAKDWPGISLAAVFSKEELANIELIAVDGVVPISVFETDFEKIYPQLKELNFIREFQSKNALSDDGLKEIIERLFYWLAFPLNPHNANKTSIMMLHGEAFPRTLTQVTDVSEEDLAVMLGLSQHNLLKAEADYAAKFEKYRDILIGAGALSLAGFVVTNVDVAIEKRKKRKQEQDMQGITRRAFLGGTAAAVVAVGTGAAISHNEVQQSQRRTRAAQDVRSASSIAEMETYEKRFRKASRWCVGHINPLEHNIFRSAIFAEKTKEALASGLFDSNDEAKIVMGNAHMWDDINDDVRNAKKRKKLIKKHFQKTLIPLVDELLKDDPRVNRFSRSSIRREVLDALVTQIASYDISELKTQTAESNFPLSLLGDGFSIKGHFVSENIKSMLGKY